MENINWTIGKTYPTSFKNGNTFELDEGQDKIRPIIQKFDQNCLQTILTTFVLCVKWSYLG